MREPGMLKNRREIIAGIVMVLSLGVLVWGITSRGTGHGSVMDNIWVYNSETEELSVIERGSAFAPIDLGEATGYRAVVYSCTSCSDEDSLRVALLVKYRPEAHAILLNGTPEQKWSVMANPGSEIAATIDMAKADQWQALGPLNDAATIRLKEECGTNLKFCVP